MHIQINEINLGEFKVYQAVGGGLGHSIRWEIGFKNNVI